METPSVRSRIPATKGPSRQRVPPAPKGRDPRTRDGPHSRASAPNQHVRPSAEEVNRRPGAEPARRVTCFPK